MSSDSGEQSRCVASVGSSARPHGSEHWIMTEEHPAHALFVSKALLTRDERRMIAFVQWMGVPTKTIVLGPEGHLTSEVLGAAHDTRPCVIMTSETLALAYQRSPRTLRQLIDERGATLMVFGWRDCRRHGEVLSWLTNGALRGVSAVAPGTHAFELPHGERELSGVFAGLSFSVTRGLSATAFDCAGEGDS